MQFIGFLILFPLILALALFFIKDDKVRHVLVYAGAGIIAVMSIVTCATGLGTGAQYFNFSSGVIDFIGALIGVVIAAVIVYFGVTHKNPLAICLACVQVLLSLIFELGLAHQTPVARGLYYDNLSLLLTFIIGVIGSGICVYALGYMKDFQAHENETKENAVDRRPFFFGLMFLFLSAMYVIVFSNNMVWLFTGWEITTVCSFLLIGYTRTSEAMRNAFRQINMNLAGGIAFVIALSSCVLQLGTLDFSNFISLGVNAPQAVVVAVTALSFAGLTKAAQVPFHTWLLGAMVAPTPTSALLHSSTMVKAGVFLLVKLAPVLAVCAIPSYMVVIIGLFTFLLCSMMAISQSNAKRVLAYSTIANLGLIAACAGIGTAEAVWAASLLILFHAIAKSLLFLCVGTAEHHIGSRNIEDMDLLFVRMPRLARFMLIGIMCMFIAPFGMLIGKWAALVSFIDGTWEPLVLIIAFGSAVTFMFWAKWFGKLCGIASSPATSEELARQKTIESTIHRSEWCAIGCMLVLILVCCVLIPVISDYVIEPYLYATYGSYGLFAQTVDDFSLWFMSILTAVVFVVILVALSRPQKVRRVPVYMAGISVNNDKRTFKNSLSNTQYASSRNWYMEKYFGESKLAKPTQNVGIFILVVTFLSVLGRLFIG